MKTINDNTIVLVTNRSTGHVYYTIPEMHINRDYNPKETKKITVGEIAAVCSQPGGRELFYNYLYVQDQEALQTTLNVKEEPEYWLTESQIPTWLKTSTVDEFKDALDYAPEGIKDLIKHYAVSKKLTDMNKRQIIQDKLNFNVTAAIEAAKPETEDEIAAAKAAATTTTRRTTPNYKIVSPKK